MLKYLLNLIGNLLMMFSVLVTGLRKRTHEHIAAGRKHGTSTRAPLMWQPAAGEEVIVRPAASNHFSL